MGESHVSYCIFPNRSPLIFPLIMLTLLTAAPVWSAGVAGSLGLGWVLVQMVWIRYT